MFSNKKNNLRQIFFECLSILPLRDRKRYWLVVLLQVFLGFLDLVGVSMMGLIGALAIRGVQSQPASPRITQILSNFGLAELTFQSQVALLGLFASTILVSRTLLSLFITRRILHFLANKSALISSSLFSKFLNLDLRLLQRNSSLELQHILGSGVTSVAVGILGTTSILVSDLSALLIIAVGLIFIDPITATISMFLFGSVALTLYFVLHKRAQEIGMRLANLDMRSNSIINQAIHGYREIYTKNRMTFFLDELTKSKNEFAYAYAVNAFLPNIGKYVVEATIILGAMTISAYQFIANDATHAVASLAIFLAAGTRIAPALLRLQQSVIAIKSSAGMASLTLKALDQVKNLEPLRVITDSENSDRKLFNPNVSIKDLSFYYSAESNFKIQIQNLKVESGETLAIVGPSGSGKSSLVDLVLGVNNPLNGEILISGFPPRLAVQIWPGAISYVPQEVLLVPGSIAANVALGFSPEEIDYNKVLEVLIVAQLHEFTADSILLEENPNQSLLLSGGQRQRIGIARALYSDPKLIIFDEATSALDGITELAISEALNSLKKKVTMILIAHRLSTVMHADRVVYLEDGKVRANGTFDEIRKQVPNFDIQAKLMGL